MSHKYRLSPNKNAKKKIRRIQDEEQAYKRMLDHWCDTFLPPRPQPQPRPRQDYEDIDEGNNGDQERSTGEGNRNSQDGPGKAIAKKGEENPKGDPRSTSTNTNKEEIQ